MENLDILAKNTNEHTQNGDYYNQVSEIIKHLIEIYTVNNETFEIYSEKCIQSTLIYNFFPFSLIIDKYQSLSDWNCFKRYELEHTFVLFSWKSSLWKNIQNIRTHKGTIAHLLRSLLKKKY